MASEQFQFPRPSLLVSLLIAGALHSVTIARIHAEDSLEPLAEAAGATEESAATAGVAEASPPIAGESGVEPGELPSLEEEILLPDPIGEALPWDDLLPDLETTNSVVDEEGFEDFVIGDDELFGYSERSSSFLGRDDRLVREVDQTLRSLELLPRGTSSPLLEQGMRFGLGVLANYDSNVRISETNEQGEYFFTVSPTVDYRSAPPRDVPGVITASYQPDFRIYPDDSSLDTVDHFAEADITYTGIRGTVAADVEYGYFSAANQVFAGRSQSEALDATLQTDYRPTDRMLLSGNGTYQRRTSDQEFGPAFEDEIISLQFDVLWGPTPQLWIGPSVQYASADSGAFGRTETLTYGLAANYTPPSLETLYLKGDLGIETVDTSGIASDSSNLAGSLAVNFRAGEKFIFSGEVSYRTVSQSVGFDVGGGGGSGQQLNGSVRMSYIPKETWMVNAGARVSSSASGAVAGESVDNAAVTLDVRKEFDRSTAQFGIIGRQSSYEVVSVPAVARPDDNSISAYATYSHRIFGDDAALSYSVQWTENSGNTDWSRFQLSSGLTFTF